MSCPCKLSSPDDEQRSLHALIVGYVRSGDPKSALSLYYKCQKDAALCPTVFVALLKACAKIKDIKTGLLLHAEVARTLSPDTETIVQNALLCMYAKCGLLTKACQVFKDMRVRDVVSWTALIGSYTEHGHGEDALEYFKQMLLEEVSPNAVTYVCCLKACGSIEARERGKSIHAEIERLGLVEKNFFVGGALVDMYGRWGWLATAQEVFDKLQARDMVVWNSLITCYAEHGQSVKALECFDLMQSQGVSPNAATFICILKVCGTLHASARGREIHLEIESKGLLTHNLEVGSTLVDMYIKCGLLARAQQVFDDLPGRDLVIWTMLVGGLSEQGHSEEALHHFERMQLEGFVLDAPMFICVLKACGIAGAHDRARDLHAEIERLGLRERDVSIGSTLVDTYARCGLLVKAQEVFDKLPTRDDVVWSALIAGYSDHGYGEEALNCLDKMYSEGVDPNVTIFVHSLKACGSIGNHDKGEEIHAEIEEKGLLEDIVIGSTLLEMYLVCGLPKKAREIFDKLPERDVVCWNTLISGLAEHGHGKESLRCLEHMQVEGVSADTVSYVSAIKACGTIRDISTGQELHAHLQREGLLQGDLIVGNALVDMYVECGSLVKARQVFYGLPTRDLVTWNALIAGYTELGHGEEAIACLEQMEQEGISPNAATFASIVKACSGAADARKGQEVHAEIVRRGLLKQNVFAGSTLVNMYAKCGLLTQAHDVFDELPIGDDAIPWNALIAGYAEHSHGEAFEVLDQMQSVGVAMTTITFVCSLKACAELGLIERGQGLHYEIARKGVLERDLLVGNTLVDMYAKCGFLATAQEVFERLWVRDMVSWSSIIGGFARIGESDKIFSSFDRMMGEGVEPDPVTLVIVLNACSRKGLVSKCKSYFDAMAKHSGLAAIEHHSCMVDLFSRAGKLDNALAVLHKMPFSPNLPVWLTLLGACQRWGNVELSKQVFERAMSVDEKDGAAYVLMSQIYADAGMQDAADEVKARRQQKEV